MQKLSEEQIRQMFKSMGLESDEARARFADLAQMGAPEETEQRTLFIRTDHTTTPDEKE